MTIHKKGQAHWEGDIKRGKGTVSTESGVLNQQPYGFNTRFEGGIIQKAKAGCPVSQVLKAEITLDYQLKS